MYTTKANRPPPLPFPLIKYPDGTSLFGGKVTRRFSHRFGLDCWTFRTSLENRKGLHNEAAPCGVNEGFSSLIVIHFVFIYSVVCKDEEGKVLVMKSTKGWTVSRCLSCFCIKGLVTCKRTLTVNFPAFFRAAYQHEETCKQPTCKILEFVRNNKKWCEGKNSYTGNWKPHFCCYC